MAAARAHDLWWALLLGRLGELKAGLPAGLKGTIQICAPSTTERPAWFRYLQLDGAATAAHDGLAPEPELWIEIDEIKLGAWLRGESDSEHALRSSGKHQLWRSLFESLHSKGQPKSWLQMRGMR